jgi:endonuclease III
VNKKVKAEEIIKELKKLFPNSKIALNYSNPIELLVAVVLSAQTTDKQVNVVTTVLFKKYKTIDDYINSTLPEFENDIKSIGLYRGKAKNIKAALEAIKFQYQGKIPDNMKELVKLPGIGRKTANVLLYVLYKKSEGIAVDTHVRRLAQVFSLSNSNNPDKIEKDLMDVVSEKDWGEITYLLIDYGRKYCPARCKHNDCPLRSYVIRKYFDTT